MASLIKSLRNTTLYCAVRVFIALLNVLPRRCALSFSGWMGALAYVAAGDARRLTLSNLTLAYGHEKSPSALRKLARSVFPELGRNVVDVARLSGITAKNLDELVHAEGLGHLNSAYAQGKGVVAVSAHLGNFELMGSYLALKGFSVTVVAAPLFDPRLDRLLLQNRERGGLNVVDRDRAAPAVLRALKKGHVVGLLADQDTRGAGVMVPFFGSPARTPTGPAILADRAGAPIVPMAIRRQPDDTHLITISPPIPPAGRSPAAVEKITSLFTAELEVFIRKAPAQWVWMHDRWKADRQAR